MNCTTLELVSGANEQYIANNGLASIVIGAPDLGFATLTRVHSRIASGCLR